MAAADCAQRADEHCQHDAVRQGDGDDGRGAVDNDAVHRQPLERRVVHRLAAAHLERRVGFPIVSTGCEFFRPAELGDTLVLELAVARLGRSSIDFRVRGAVRGDEKFRARHKVAMVSLDSFRSLPIPDEMRARMADYVVAAE